MSASDFGLGGRWPRPEQAAAGALDDLPASRWPMLAAQWLAAGFDSQPLRQLAQLQSGESPAARRPGDFAEPVPGQGDGEVRAVVSALDLMPEVLRSIGFDPAAADEAFTARCQGAVDVVQHDLDVTGYGRYRMRARFGRGWPGTVYATLPDGSYRAAGGEGMTRDLDGSWLLFAAAESVSATIEEILKIEWPVCAVHADDPRTRWEPAVQIRKVAWWQCTRARHTLAPVGQLTAEIARTL
jgi:hypothetical protein